MKPPPPEDALFVPAKKKGNPRTLFSFYGSKSQIAGRYPAPKHDVIVEPFAGSASYSLRYAEREVLLNELDPLVYSMWDYLIHTPVDDVLQAIPKQVKKGDRASEMVEKGAHPGLLGFLQANVNMGTQGGRGVHDCVTWFAELHWGQVARRAETYLPKIRHWKVTNTCYSQVPNRKATWFIDPPYNNEAGARYRQQVIVCENAGADWLPFNKSVGKAKTRGGARQAGEVIFYRESTE